MSLISRTRLGLQTILQQTQTTGKESVQLARACWTAYYPRGSSGGGGGDYKTVLLQQAQQHGNRTAIRLLLLEKEYGLLRYYGLATYLQQTAWWNRTRQRLPRMPSFWSIAGSGSSSEISTSSTFTADNKSTSVGNGDDDDGLERQSKSNSRDGDDNDSSNNNNNNNNNNGVAKVAFMVTSRMKTELGESLGYDASQVRTMTPVEASLVLEHRVLPKDYDERIPVLRKEHEKAVALQAAAEQQALRQRQEEEEEEEKKRLAAWKLESNSGSGSGNEHDGIQQSTLEGTDNSQQTIINKVPSPSFQLSFPQTNAFSTTQDDKEKTPTTDSIKKESISTADDENKKGTLWYELVQTSNDDEENVVGLYRTQEEANFGREVHEELAQGRAKRGDKDAESWSFQVRTTVR